ncbi:MAG: hypothetical protein PWQ96_385 [Clostridia bacterium]|jgi:histone acetyltransferase (RNA polymerase elongator complex component)|nr:Radical domain protein [Clostridiales bacterium]MDK2984743.1 hypothetical protein [Clostridia bacterium]
MKKKYVIPLFVPHMGCPHQCVFCDQRTISGQRGIPDVVNTIEEYLRSFKNKEIPIEVAFYGGSFTAIPIEIQRELLEKTVSYIKSGKVQKIRLSTRPDAISHEILDFLKEYNVSIIELGVQSLNNKVLELSGRGHNSEIVFWASKRIKESGFTLGIQLMPGLPGDTREKIFSTVQDVIAIKPDFVRIYPTVVVKGTPLEKMYKDGKFTPLSLQCAIQLAAEMYEEFYEAGISVIRLGLQPTEELLSADCIVAGPFHPAFGELVKGEIAFKEMCKSLDDFYKHNPDSEKIEIHVPHKKLSIFLGQRKINMERIYDKYSREIRLRGEKNLLHRIVITNNSGITKEYQTKL